MKPRVSSIGLAICCAFGSAAAGLAHGHGPHVHGVAMLELATEGPALEMRLLAPLESLLGFEHFPRTDAERAALRAMEKALSRPDSLLVPSPAARCALASAALDAKLAQGAHAPASDAGKPAAATKDSGEAHGDLEAHYVFRCQQPDALRSIEVRLFQAYPRLEHVDVRIAGPRGQRAGRVTPGNRTFAW